MRRSLSGTISLVVLLAWAGGLAPSAAEPPPVRDGLVVWLDAAEQPRARQTGALPPLANHAGVECWIDGSESAEGRDFHQPVEARRPRWISDGTTAFVRFDGKDDFLFAAAGPRLTPECTVFLLAAPRSNAGNFTGPFAVSAAGGNDYTHGLNIDFGMNPGERLDFVNVEAAGAGGMRDLLVPGVLGAADRPFGGFHLFTVRSRIAPNGMEFFLDGFMGGARDRLESMIGLDRMVVGARYYSNEPGIAPQAQGFFQGDIAALAVYDRALRDDERSAMEEYLLSRTNALAALTSGRSGHPLEVVENPPPVQILVPGFSVEEAPLALGNLTGIRYRHDGRLVALGYDGRIHLLEDTDDDGMPDRSELWWDNEGGALQAPVGLALLPAGDPRGEGVFVPSKGKFSLILDRDRDGRAEEEIIVASGWPGTFAGVDALGVAIDPRDGSIVFSIGCANFADAYQVDPDGVSRYDLASPRGTVQRVSADLQSRSTVATGVRFLCALAFNREGDLFATEQEGATWLPNGNPFDELLQIEDGRHYGFPPRHPRHLPDVLDDPAVFEYGPQHQSTCGMVFNEGVNGGPPFGPAHWHGDAIVCGESRGKLWRTRLARTPEGYVAQTHLFACLNLLTVDTCVTPGGDLLVACHSGPPDWGTGPAGTGHLFLIRWVNRDAPQPVTAWASAPDEFRIAFDRPMQPSDWAGALDAVRIEAGEFVAAGDRFESVRPGYQVVRDQMASPRRWIEPASLQLSSDGRTLAVRLAAPQTEPVTYAVTLPLPDGWGAASAIAQSPEIDVALTLHGVEAEAADGFRTVLPHPSIDASRTLAAGSAEHERFLAAVSGNVLLRARIDRTNIFQPSIQPGSTLDWDVAADPFANRLMTIRDGASGREVRAEPADESFVDVQHRIAAAERLVFSLDDQVRALSPQRIHVPWTRNASGVDALTDTPPEARTDVTGDWLRGRRLYFGAAACWTCHVIRGEGIAVGPDLSNLVHRDRASVLADILDPSAAINPDHAGSLVTRRDGSLAAGIVVESSPERVVLLAAGGLRTALPRPDVVSVEPMPASLMPEGLTAGLDAADAEDLLTFLLINPLEVAAITRRDPPPPPARSVDELRPFLPISPPADSNTQDATPLRILLCASEKDHGTDEHDYPLWVERWNRLLGLAEGVSVRTTMGFPSADLLAEADVAVLYSSNPGWNLRAARDLDVFQRRGGGLVLLHWSIEGHEHPEELADAVGLAFSGSSFRHGDLELTFPPLDHAVTRGFDSPLRLVDESYWNLAGKREHLGILATSVEDGEPQPQIWIREQDGDETRGRVFGCIPGHYTWTFDDPLYRILILRGLCWAARLPDIDRLNELAIIGARIRPTEPSHSDATPGP